MITIPISVQISGGTAPYLFTFASTNSNVTFSNITGTAILSTGSYYASTDVLYPLQSQIATTTISCTFTDANGCSKVLSPVTISNPCTLQSTISTNGEFVFVATTTGGSGDYSYEWNYDSGLFSKAPGDVYALDNYLSLTLNSLTPIPTSTVITVLITDANNCTLFKSYTYTFCKPSTNKTRRIGLVCDTTEVVGCSFTASQYRNLSLTQDWNVCSNQVLDWSTASFNVPVGLCVIHDGLGKITISSSLTTSQTKDITYTVKTTSGITSAVATITVTIPECALEGRPSFSGVPTSIQLVSGDIIGTVKVIPVESRVSGNPDWSTFVFTNTPSWGTVLFNGNREITYTITDIATTPTIPDVIKWSLNDYSGGQINITDTVYRDTMAVPTTVLDVICNSCGETTAPFDVLANDTGSIDRSTLTITLTDPQIVVTKDSNNNLIFTSLPGASFANLCKYKVANTQGVYSAEQGFFVRVACVGDNANPSLDLTCVVSKVFDIKDQFTNSNSFGDVFVETTPAVPTYASQGGVIVGAEGTVTLTGLVNKTYTFQYTASNVVACSPDFDDIGVLTVVHGVTPFINLSAATLVSAGVYSFTFTYSGIASNFTVLDDSVAAVFHTGIVANSGTGSFTLYAAAASSILISASTVCGAITTDTTVI